jgi:hypothetical protein
VCESVTHDEALLLRNIITSNFSGDIEGDMSDVGVKI